jgi:hypothetical protein
MKVSKFMPRLVMGNVLGLTLSMLTSQFRLDNHEDCKTVDYKKNHPFDPDDLSKIRDQFWEQVEDRDTQPIDGVKENTEEDEQLKHGVVKNVVQYFPNLRPNPKIPAFQKRCREMHRQKYRHTRPANAMQDVGQVRTLSFVSQCRREADVSIDSHLKFSLNKVREPIVARLIH